MEFDRGIFYGHLVKGALRDALAYTKQFPDQIERYRRYMAVFEEEKLPQLEVGDDLSGLLRVYQKYYRDVFYLEMEAADAVETMKKRFADLLGLKDTEATFDEMEEAEIASAFRSQGFSFQGGRTGRYYGPYVWNQTERKEYRVELPNGVETYTVKLLDGFLSKSWMHAISFGEVSTGGWIDEDGIICCIRDSYNFQNEDFLVSLLKHEAQHAVDRSNYINMSSEDLEYRAKLVELIYSEKRNLLNRFRHEADNSNPWNGHSMAAYRIMEEFAKSRPGKGAGQLSAREIQETARELFQRSEDEIRRKYS